MKNLSYLLIVFSGMLLACTATKKIAYSPLGNWDYTVRDTPNGDVSGTLVLSKDGEQYKGVLQSSMGSVDLENVKVEDNQLRGTFEMEGYELELIGTFAGEELEGTVGFEGYTFPLKGSRVKK